jgi:hypothetical protein
MRRRQDCTDGANTTNRPPGDMRLPSRRAIRRPDRPRRSPRIGGALRRAIEPQRECRDPRKYLRRSQRPGVEMLPLFSTSTAPPACRRPGRTAPCNNRRDVSQLPSSALRMRCIWRDRALAPLSHAGLSRPLALLCTGRKQIVGRSPSHGPPTRRGRVIVRRPGSFRSRRRTSSRSGRLPRSCPVTFAVPVAVGA